MGAEARGGSLLLKIYTGLVYIFLFAPILVVMLTSFNPTGRATIPPLHGRWR